MQRTCHVSHRGCDASRLRVPELGGDGNAWLTAELKDTDGEYAVVDGQRVGGQEANPCRTKDQQIDPRRKGHESY